MERRPMSVQEIAAMFTGGSKPENMQAFLSRRAHEEDAYRTRSSSNSPGARFQVVEEKFESVRKTAAMFETGNGKSPLYDSQSPTLSLSRLSSLSHSPPRGRGDHDVPPIIQDLIMLPNWLFESEEEDEDKKASTAAKEYVLDFSLDVSEIEHDDAGALQEISSESSEDVEDDNNDGESESDDHGDVPMPLQPDDPYRDFDDILDYGADERPKKSSPLWSFFSCCLE